MEPIIFAAVLGRKGYPPMPATAKDIETYEGSVLLDYLRILDNFMQELPLTLYWPPRLQVWTRSSSGHPQYAGTSLLWGSLEYALPERVRRRSPEKASAGIFWNWNISGNVVPYTAIHELLWRSYPKTRRATASISIHAGQGHSIVETNIGNTLWCWKRRLHLKAHDYKESSLTLYAPSNSWKGVRWWLWKPI